MHIVTLFIERIRNEKRLQYILLAGIVILGIFLRTFHFQSWMEFSPDQARDATLIGEVISGQEPLPLLGAESGNTRFDLGPMPYHWQYLSGLIFGSEPYNLAYPDLIFSIFAIVLFFFLMQKYFTAEISLLLTLLMSVSFFIVKYSRFAWNPNAAPFFSLLFVFSLLAAIDPKNKGKLLWPALIGTSMGVAIQLHTLFIFILPVVAGVGFLLWIRRGLFSWRGIFLLLACFLAMNWAQIYRDVNHNYSNSNRFLKALTNTSSGSSGSAFSRNIDEATACEVQSGVYMLSSWGNLGKCEPWEVVLRQHDVEIRATFIFGFLLIFGGYVLFGRYLWQEIDDRRRDFLLILAVYAGVSFVISIPIITQVSTRYYITSFFLPFVLVGLWMKFLSGRFVKTSAIFAVAMASLFLLLLAGNVRSLSVWSWKLAHGSASDSKTVFYTEMRDIMSYMEATLPQRNIGLLGSHDSMSRFLKPLNYLADHDEVSLVDLSNKHREPQGKFFYIGESIPESDLQSMTSYKGYRLEGHRIFGQIMVLTLYAD
ncbi:MAG: glycosyltransferase family 39 protein [Candidatus Moraniibacteriota bacterium]